MRNFYKVLGVATKADDQRIKTAFRRRAKSVHPDLNPGNRRAEARFIELMQAYEVLSDTKTRAAYDSYLADQRRESRRRFAHCAGLMMTSFVMTAASAVFVLSLAGANVPFREAWQLTVAILSPADATASASKNRDFGWATQVAVAPEDGQAPSPNRSEPERKVGAKVGADSKTAQTRRAAAPTKAQTAKAHHAAPDATGSPTKSSRQQMATAPRQASPSAAKRADPPPFVTPEESWPPAPPPSDEPRYGLGASDLR